MSSICPTKAACVAQCLRIQDADTAYCEARCSVDDNHEWLVPLALCCVGVAFITILALYVGGWDTLSVVEYCKSTLETRADETSEYISVFRVRQESESERERERDPESAQLLCRADELSRLMGRITMGLTSEKQTPAPAQVAQMFTLAMLQGDRSQGALILAAAHPRTEGPSWVMDTLRDSDAYWACPSMKFQANTHATLRSSFEFRQGPQRVDTLVLRGRTICTVRACRVLQPTSDEFIMAETKQHLHNLATLLRLFDSHFPTFTSPRLHPELKDLICNRDNHPTLPDTVTNSHLYAYYNFLQAFHEIPPGDVLLVLAHESEYWRFHEDSSWKSLLRPRSEVKLGEVLNAHIAVSNSLCSTNKKFFSTLDMDQICTASQHKLNPRNCISRKSWFFDDNTLKNTSGQPMAWGICTNDVQKGDKVILVAGLATPLIVRQDVLGVKLQSPAFVIGVMQGQAWPCGIRDNGDDRLEDIVIC